MNDLLTDLKVPEVPVVVELDTDSLFKLGLTLFITAVLIVLAIRYINK